MPAQKKNEDSFPFKGIKTFVSTEGLDDFVKVLERDFFADVHVQYRYHTEKERTDLILDVHCNFGFTESLHHFNNGNWGGFSGLDTHSSLESSFGEAFQQLCVCNNHKIDIAELSIHFQDTTVVITRVQDYSVPEELKSIILHMCEHFVYFTKGLTEMPYEIFVPVFEDKTKNETKFTGNRRNYYEHWGLYFEDDLNYDVMVYSLKTKELQKENFFLLD